MKCINCNKAGPTVDLTDNPIAIEQYVNICNGDPADPESHQEMVINVHADRVFGWRPPRRLQVCEQCLQNMYSKAIAKMFAQKSWPKVHKGGKSK